MSPRRNEARDLGVTIITGAASLKCASPGCESGLLNLSVWSSPTTVPKTERRRCARTNNLTVSPAKTWESPGTRIALSSLHRILDCDVIILIRGRFLSSITLAGRSDWIEAVRKWGHIISPGLVPSARLGEKGSVDSPFLSLSLSGQCAAFSRQALAVCGFMDSRFKSYGYEHAEHSSRLVRAGFGGEMRMAGSGQLEPHYYFLAADLSVSADESFRNEESLAFQFDYLDNMHGDPVYRHPWRTTGRVSAISSGNAGRDPKRANFSRRRQLLLKANVGYQWPLLSEPVPRRLKPTAG